jgi:hypothetical protein
MKKILSLVVLFMATVCQAGVIGYSAFPLVNSKNLLSAGLDSVVSSGGGIGISASYTQKINSRLIADGGLGVSGADQTGSKIFLGADYEFMPDYLEQPRVSVKFRWLNEDQFSYRINRVSAAPTMTKGFSFWGKEAYPYAAIPFGVDFNGDTKTYETFFNLTVGINGQLPFKGYEKITGNVEMSLNVKDSYSSISVGMSIPVTF